jgi:hypothetical protein
MKQNHQTLYGTSIYETNVFATLETHFRIVELLFVDLNGCDLLKRKEEGMGYTVAARRAGLNEGR